MFNINKISRTISIIIRQIKRWLHHITKISINRLLRNLFRWKSKSRLSTSGFVLPTVAMVTLVVVLLSAALVIRSFDRTRNVSNYRVNQEVLNAALPALDRAKAKIAALMEDPNLPRGTPTDVAINDVLTRDKYNLGDEERLTLAFDIDDDGQIETLREDSVPFNQDETNLNAWRFPLDTDNNGLFDSYALYTIVFRSPSAVNGGFNRKRSPLDARSLPMSEGAVVSDCAAAAGTTAALVGVNGWFNVNGQLKKSFFTYVATLPITDTTNLDPQEFETYRGNQGFAALEFQQDQARIPLANNAIVYQDDLDISAGSGQLNINGRIYTSSNLFVVEGVPVAFRQVSSPDSCFYEAENAKIVIGGNISYGRSVTAFPSADIEVDLYQKAANGNGQDGFKRTRFNATNNSVASSVTTPQIAYNNLAYENRLNTLVEQTLALGPQNFNDGDDYLVRSADPDEVTNAIQDRLDSANPPNDITEARRQELEKYFRKRTRRVPYIEVAYELGNNDPESLQGNSTRRWQMDDSNPNTLRPIDEWMYPFDPSDGKNSSNFARLELSGDNTLEPAATKESNDDPDSTENLVGDRILVGNNLPQLWWDPNAEEFAGEETEQDIEDTFWNDEDGGVSEDTPRYRLSRVREADDLGGIDRDDFWETMAAQVPSNELDGTGGLRVITGAGLYLPPDDADFANASQIVWPDYMPVIHNLNGHGTDALAAGAATWPTWLKDKNFDGIPFPIDQGNKYRPYLKMRASAVYHYGFDDDNDPQTPAPPIACVSSFYDPTDRASTHNIPITGLSERERNVSGEMLTNYVSQGNTTARVPNLADGANSNNGIVYGAPTISVASIQNILEYEANLVYPNGRLVNPMLKEALEAATPSLAQQAAIDAALCAYEIHEGRLTAGNGLASGYTIPNGAIKEVSFLDARQIKAVDGGDPDDTDDVFETQYGLSGEYRLPIEQRQPLEIRATVLDMSLLRTTRAGDMRLQDVNGTTSLNAEQVEYLLPNSGIIYASRDDALPDVSDVLGSDANNDLIVGDEQDSNPNIAATDFLLDPTRRPNAIMLINGQRLGRANGVGADSNDFRDVEKGLILATNLPVYVQGDFNVHEDAGGTAQEEFTQVLTDRNFYDRTTLNTNFACRSGDPRLPSNSCTDPDEWRAATILSDAVTLLSSAFREGNRAEGDFDSRNNQIDNLAEIALDLDRNNTDDITDVIKENHLKVEQLRLKNGFWNNDFAVNGLSSNNANAFNTTQTDLNNGRNLRDQEYRGNPDNNGTLLTNLGGGSGRTNGNSSYFNNFVTPVQRRTNNFPEYAMEICRRLPVSNCTPDDWVVGYDRNGDDDLDDDLGIDLNGDGINDLESSVTVSQLGFISGSSTLDDTTRELLGAGTTVNSPLVAADQRFPRRVAFARNLYGGLAVNDSFNNSLRPLGDDCPLDNTGNVPEDNGCVYPNNGNSVPSTNHGNNRNNNNQNALWFRTTNNTRGEPWNNRGFRSDKPLAYEEPPTEKDRFLLPPVSLEDKVDNSLSTTVINAARNAEEFLNFGEPNSTNPDNQPASYTVCVFDSTPNSGTSTEYEASNLNNDCPAGVRNGVNRAGNQLRTLANTIVATPIQDSDGDNRIVLNANSSNNFNAYELPFQTVGGARFGFTQASNLMPSVDINGNGDLEDEQLILELNGDQDSVFIFKAEESQIFQPVAIGNVTMVLNGVNPNNIFWLSFRGIYFAGNNTLAGNFLSGSDGHFLNFPAFVPGGGSIDAPINFTNATNTRIFGGRLLGFGADSDGIPSVDLSTQSAFNGNNDGNDITTSLTLTAITSQNQPLLWPVLQLQYITSAPGNNVSNTNPRTTGSTVNQTQWQPRAITDLDNPTSEANSLILNAVIATGDTPVHPATATAPAIGSDFNGGLVNIIRLLEDFIPNGSRQTMQFRLRGAIMQIRRSRYSTAPFEPLIQPYWEATFPPNGIVGGLFDYAQSYGHNQNFGSFTREPYYSAPGRDIGFDVGILSQLPDLFAQQFTAPPTEKPNEFFREVNRGDEWIETLLCGRLERDPDEFAIVDGDQRPNQCFDPTS